MLSSLEWKVNAVTPLTFLFFFLQATDVVGNKTAFPEFNEHFLSLVSTLLDLTRLDHTSYDFDFHVLAAAIVIRVSYKIFFE